MATTPVPIAGAYEELAPYYDALTSGSDYEAWTERILALLRSYAWAGSTVLDLACGTGSSFLRAGRDRLLRVPGEGLPRAGNWEERDPPRAAPRRVRGPAHASGPKHGTWSRSLRRDCGGSLSPAVPSAGERKFDVTW
jgi:hypothetical protein